MSREPGQLHGLAYRLAAAHPGEVVVMLDLDHFESINDTLDHHHGDVVLSDFASMLSRLVNSGDSVARYGGGEEFCVIVSPQVLQPGQPGETDQSGQAMPTARAGAMPTPFARSAAYRAEHLLAEARRLWASRQPGITLSSGRAEIAPASSASQAVVKADEALYAAKAGGRNRDEVAPSGLPARLIPAEL